MPSDDDVSASANATILTPPPTLEDIQAAFDSPPLTASLPHGADDHQSVDDSEDDSLFSDNIQLSDNIETIQEIDEDSEDFRQVINHDKSSKRNRAPDPPGQTEVPEKRKSKGGVDGPRSQTATNDAEETRKQKLTKILIAAAIAIAIIIWITIFAVRSNASGPATGDPHPSIGNLLPVGNVVRGQSPQSFFGSSIALSADGKIMAVGAPGDGNLNGNQAGQVAVYSLDVSNKWQLRGHGLQGTGRFGAALALSGDGSLLLVADPVSASALTFKFDGTSWIEGGSLVYGTVFAIASNGQVMAASSPNSGTVTSYIQQSNGYYNGYQSTYIGQQSGQPLVSSDANEMFGYCIALSASGNVLAVGAPKNSDTATYSGKVKVFSFSNSIGAWQQVGNDIRGDFQMDRLGSSVALSSDGTMVAVGLITGDQRGGEVRVYRYNANAQTWTRMGRGATGENPFSGLGLSIALSNDGTRVAAGAPQDTDSGRQYNGLARVFEVSDDVWIQIGSDLQGEQDNDGFGRVVALSGDGTVLAVSAPNSTLAVTYDSQGLPNAGYVSIYNVKK